MDRIANARTEVSKPQSAEPSQENFEGQSLLGPESESAMQLQAAADESPQVKQLKAMQEAANNSLQVRQLRRMQDAANGRGQLSQGRAQEGSMPSVQLKAAVMNGDGPQSKNQAHNKPALQLKGLAIGQNEGGVNGQPSLQNSGNLQSNPPAQLKVKKRKAGEWYSTYDPFTLHATKAAATKYDQACKAKGMEETKERTPTLYTYTHTKPHCKIGSVPQGPHTVAHKISWDRLAQLSSLAEVQEVFEDQVLTPDDASEVVFQDEAPDSGFSGQMDARLQRWASDYKQIYQNLEAMLANSSSSLVDAKSLLNRLLQMDPYATYAWKTTKAASKASLRGKGESKPDASFEQLVDQPPKSSFRNQDAVDSFMDSREQMYEDSRMKCDDDDE